MGEEEMGGGGEEEMEGRRGMGVEETRGGGPPPASWRRWRRRRPSSARCAARRGPRAAPGTCSERARGAHAQRAPSAGEGRRSGSEGSRRAREDLRLALAADGRLVHREQNHLVVRGLRGRSGVLTGATGGGGGGAAAAPPPPAAAGREGSGRVTGHHHRVEPRVDRAHVLGRELSKLVEAGGRLQARPRRQQHAHGAHRVAVERAAHSAAHSAAQSRGAAHAVVRLAGRTAM